MIVDALNEHTQYYMQIYCPTCGLITFELHSCVGIVHVPVSITGGCGLALGYSGGPLNSDGPLKWIR